MTELHLPDGWARVRLDEVAEVRLGRQRSPKNHSGDQMRPYLRAANVTWQGLDLSDVNEMNFTDAEIETYRLRDGDLLLSEASGSPGEVGKPAVWRGQMSGDVCFQNTLLRVRPERGVDSDYLYFRLLHDCLSGRFAASARGVGIHHLGAAALATLDLTLPPTGEQRRIATALEHQFRSLSAVETAVRRQRQKLAVLRRGVLAAGTDGDLTDRTGDDASALVAEATETWPTAYESLHGRPPRTAALPPEPVSEPDLRLPDGWRWVRLGQVALAQNGTAFPSSNYAADGIRLLRPGNLHVSGEVRWGAQNTRHMPDRYGDTHSRFLVGGGEIVVNLTAQSLKDEFLGRVCMTGTRDVCLLNQRIARLVPLGVHPRFLFYALKAPRFRRFVDSLNSGSLIQHMHTRHLDDYCFPLPPLVEQAAIVVLLDTVMSAIDRADHDLAALAVRLTGAHRAVLAAAVTGQERSSADPLDEPAELLLKRIREWRTAVGPAAGHGRKSSVRRGRASRAN